MNLNPSLDQPYPFVNGNNHNLNASHPLIPNAQEYMHYKKFISVHSEDRDILKFPSSSEFEIELPEDYLNVFTLKLINWTFPANYNTFSSINGNVLLEFQITNPYNPAAFGVPDDLNYRIFEALFQTAGIKYSFAIEEGFYNPPQMATELTNKFNAVVTFRIEQYFADKIVSDPSGGWDVTLQQFKDSGGYTRFVVVYNNVSLKLWFGNSADTFVLLSKTGELSNIYGEDFCGARGRLPDYSTYGLPGYLGLARCDQASVSSFGVQGGANYATVNGQVVPRFYYGDVFPGDNGFWLLPLDMSGCQVQWVEAYWKLNIMGEAYIYMEISGQNCIDETKPFNVSKFTTETNQTNGVVNAAFAKLAVPTTPLSQWFDRDSVPYKAYYPPAERIRRLRFKLRYHNGQNVDFGVLNYSFTLEFTLLVPVILRNTKTGVLMPQTGII